MGLSINTNVAALNAYRNLSTTQNDLSKSLEKLSSGFRINRAADDAAGLAISEGMRSQIGGIKMGVRNAQDGISVVQTAEGALNETHSILQRMRDLSVQASNSGSLNDKAKANIQTEVTQLGAELDRIATTTKFNGKALLDGNYTGSFQVGANVGETINVAVTQDMSALGLSVNSLDVTTAAGAGATKSAWVSSAAVGTSTITVGGKDFTAATADAAGWDAMVTEINDAGVGVVASHSTGTLTLTAATNGPSSIAVAGVAGSLTLGANGATSGAENAITAIDSAIEKVSTARSGLGAVQNRFEHTINNLNVAVENLSASESRIRDTDMAAEMVQFTRSQILSQAGTAMLAQAKSIPQGVLQLLQ